MTYTKWYRKKPKKLFGQRVKYNRHDWGSGKGMNSHYGQLYRNARNSYGRRGWRLSFW